MSPLSRAFRRAAHRIVGVAEERCAAVHRRVRDDMARDLAFARVRVRERAGRIGDRADAALAIRARVVAEGCGLAGGGDRDQPADVVVAVAGRRAVGARHQVAES